LNLKTKELIVEYLEKETDTPKIEAFIKAQQNQLRELVFTSSSINAKELQKLLQNLKKLGQ